MRFLDHVQVIAGNLVNFQLIYELSPAVLNIERRRQIGCGKKCRASGVSLRYVFAHCHEIQFFDVLQNCGQRPANALVHFVGAPIRFMFDLRRGVLEFGRNVSELSGKTEFAEVRDMCANAFPHLLHATARPFALRQQLEVTGWIGIEKRE